MSMIIIQGIGFLALFFVVLSFQKKERVSLLFIMLIGMLLFVVHYCLLKAWTGALMNFIEAGVVFVSFKKETSRWAQKRFWPYLFALIYIITGILTFSAWYNILPVIAQIFGAIAVWQKNSRTIRFIMLVPRPLWFTYNFIVGSYAGVVTEIFILASVVTGIVRFDILHQKEN